MANNFFQTYQNITNYIAVVLDKAPGNRNKLKSKIMQSINDFNRVFFSSEKITRFRLWLCALPWFLFILCLGLIIKIEMEQK
jgi:hypothetical protein